MLLIFGEDLYAKKNNNNKSPEKTFANIAHIKIQKYDYASWYKGKNINIQIWFFYQHTYMKKKYIHKIQNQK